MGNPFKKPKMPEPSERDEALRNRQMRALDRETEEENRRRRLILQGRLGMRQLLTGSASGIMGEGSPGSGATAGGGTTPGSTPAAPARRQFRVNPFGISTGAPGAPPPSALI